MPVITVLPTFLTEPLLCSLILFVDSFSKKKSLFNKFSFFAGKNRGRVLPFLLISLFFHLILGISLNNFFSYWDKVQKEKTPPYYEVDLDKVVELINKSPRDIKKNSQNEKKNIKRNKPKEILARSSFSPRDFAPSPSSSQGSGEKEEIEKREKKKELKLSKIGRKKNFRISFPKEEGKGKKWKFLKNSYLSIVPDLSESDLEFDDLNTAEKIFYSCYKRISKQYVNSILSEVRDVPNFVRKDLKKEKLIGEILYNKEGKIKKLKILQTSDSYHLQSAFIKALEGMEISNLPEGFFGKKGEILKMTYVLDISP